MTSIIATSGAPMKDTASATGEAIARSLRANGDRSAAAGLEYDDKDIGTVEAIGSSL